MKVLIVEDNDSSREFLYNLLQYENFDLAVSKNGLEALEIFDEFKPDLILSDIQMPIMDGLELLEAIRKKDSDTIFIIITAFGTEEYAIKALRLGANNYLKKPIRNKDLLSILEKYKNLVDKHEVTEPLPIYIRRSFSASLENRIAYVPQFVEKLLNETNCNVNINDRTSMELGLVELLTNSIEHGNLEITFQEKQIALEKGTLEQLYKDKQAIEEYAKRRVTIEFYHDEDFCEWIIKDEGKGFDWNLLPNPTHSENLLSLSGRGIFITRFLFDELEYLGRGNIVRAKKMIKR